MIQLSKPQRRHMKDSSVRSLSERSLALEAAASWPIFECLISQQWRNTGNLSEILISKEPPFGGVVSCLFLVDLGCLGPKQSFVTQFRTRNQYETEFRSMIMDRSPMIPVEYSLGTKIIKESIAYSSKLGFGLHQSVQNTLKALGSLDASADCHEEIHLGASDGKPLYIAGPHDDVDSVMSTLVSKCGNGNFHFSKATESPFSSGFFD